MKLALEKTLNLTQDHFEKNDFWYYTVAPSESNNSYLTTAFGHQHFDHQNLCHWLLRYSGEKAELQKYSLLSQIHEKYPWPVDTNWINANTSPVPDSLPPFIYCNTLAISPNGKYVLVRYYWGLHILCERKTNRIVTDNLPEGEIVLGFDSQSNIYSGRLASPPEFVVRDPETMQSVKSFHRTIESDTDKHDTFEQNLFYMACPFPVESSDRKYVVFQFYQHRPPGVTIKMYENDPRLLKEWVEKESDDSRRCFVGKIHVYDQESGLLVYESPFGISQSNLLPMLSTDGKLILYPDNAAKGVWSYNFETKKSKSLLIPPPEMSGTHYAWEKEAYLQHWKETWSLRGFTFTPENQVLVWLYNRDNRAIPHSSIIYLFNPESASHQVLTDFVSEKEFVPEGEFSEYNKVRSTWHFFFSPDQRTAITFQMTPNRPAEFAIVGKYVFWDYRTKKTLRDTGTLQAEYYLDPRLENDDFDDLTYHRFRS